MKPYLHSKISAKKFGGKPEDYLDIHDFIDSSKAHHADVRHRAILHHAFGCFLVEQLFGTTRFNSADKEYSPREVAEEHLKEDTGIVAPVEHYLRNIDLMVLKNSFPSMNHWESYKHAEEDVKKYGGSPDDYLPVHKLLDSSWGVMPDERHLTLMHHSFGVTLVEKIIGEVVTNANNRKIATRAIAATHIERELGFIPTVHFYLMQSQMQDWMSGTLKTKTSKTKFIPFGAED